MKVDRISVSGFRNYSDGCAEFDPGINVITGANAQGKTNLLEAVFLLTGNHSFRTRYDRELVGFDCSWADILADIESDGRQQTVKMTFRPGQRRSITCNGVKKTSAEMSGLFNAVLFCPDDLNLIKEGASARRRMMDMAICQLRPGYASVLSEFSRLYEHKTRILKDWREKPDLMDMLDDFSAAMAKCSAQLIRYRASYVQRLSETAAPIHREFSGDNEELYLEYRTVSTVRDPLGSYNEIYAAVCDHQDAHRRAELDSGMCLTGAHKDDIEITINGQSSRKFASQGQTRTAALSIKLAEREIFLNETGEWPVLLLDDVLSELDAKRQEFVLNRINGGQTLITCCENGDQIAGRTGGKVFEVRGGMIREH